MFRALYDWMYQITFYLVIFVAALQLLPSGNYIKYVKFFVGLVLILLVLSPVMKLLGTRNLSQIISEKNQEVADFEEILKQNDNMKSGDIEKQAAEASSSVVDQNTEDSNGAEEQGVTENNRTSCDGMEKGGQNTENGQKQIFVEPVRVE